MEGLSGSATTGVIAGGDHPHFEARGISKWFGGVCALDDVSVAIERGTIHALVGENGAGKSTLGRVIAGHLRSDAGSLLLDGRGVSYRAPREALADGIAGMAQELALVPARSVIENVFLGKEQRRAGVVRTAELERRYRALMQRLQFELPPEARVAELPLVDRQKVEIARAVGRDAQLIVMDEPTAALSAEETRPLLATIRSLVAEGTTIVFISHFLEEVLEIGDTVTIMRDGRIVRTAPAAEETCDSLVSGMLGRSMEQTFPPRVSPAADPSPLLSIEGATHYGRFADVSLQVGRGEIVGLAGLVGSGRTELARAVFGAERLDAGEVRIEGSALRSAGPRAAIRAGLQMLPEDRKTDGLVMQRSVVDNITLGDLGAVATSHVIRRKRERARAEELIDRIDIRSAGPRATVSALSGGNQQKVLFARCLFTQPRVLIADEPTRGIDIGAKRVIYELLASLAREGMGILLISSELEELLGLSHRVAVMRRGALVAELSAGEISEERVMAAAFGTDPNGGVAG